jgi:hypothetical protein
VDRDCTAPGSDLIRSVSGRSHLIVRLQLIDTGSKAEAPDAFALQRSLRAAADCGEWSHNIAFAVQRMGESGPTYQRAVAEHPQLAVRRPLAGGARKVGSCELRSKRHSMYPFLLRPLAHGSPFMCNRNCQRPHARASGHPESQDAGGDREFLSARKFWIPAFAGMTPWERIAAIAAANFVKARPREITQAIPLAKACE